MSHPIKIFLTDVDGVLTDAGMYYTESGDEFKKFSTYDGMAFQLLREHKIKTGILTSENTKIVAARAKKTKADYLYQGIYGIDKLKAASEICSLEGITLMEVAYIGDDLNCISLLRSVGVAACPANAVAEVKAIPGIIKLSKKGGEGVVREFVELLLNKK
jgi:3-deoxy-D-manno-octulosonate 8-phosphate phosphatase (KDO 8-P phosphatase)